MYRYIAAAFSSSVILLSLYNVVYPAAPLSILMSPDFGLAAVRIILAGLLLFYSLLPSLRYGVLREGLLLSGMGIVFVLATSLVAENAPFLEPFDVFFALQGSIICLIAAFDFARPKSAQKFMPNITAVEILVARLRTLRIPTFPTQRKPA